MKDMGKMMKQAQKMQQKMSEVQEKMGQMEIDGSAGGGMVTVTMNGKGECRKVKIDPSLIDPNDAEVLEDLVVAAVNDAKGRVEERMQEEMQEVTGGMELPPGFQMPFGG